MSFETAQASPLNDTWLFNGTITGLAVRPSSGEDDPGSVYACARTRTDAPWYLLTFSLADVSAGVSGFLSVEKAQKLEQKEFAPGETERCTLTWQPAKRLDSVSKTWGDVLWVGALTRSPTQAAGKGSRSASAQRRQGRRLNEASRPQSPSPLQEEQQREDGATASAERASRATERLRVLTLHGRRMAQSAASSTPGWALAFDIDSTTHMPLLTKSKGKMEYGSDVAGFAFFTNTFGEAHLALARCDARTRKAKPCKLEFHNVNEFEEKALVTMSHVRPTAWSLPGSCPCHPRLSRVITPSF